MRRGRDRQMPVLMTDLYTAGFARYASGTESVAPYGLFSLYRVSWYYCFATAAVLYTLACYIWPV